MAALVFEIVKTFPDDGSVAVGDMPGRGCLTGRRLDNGPQQTTGIAVARRGLRADPLMLTPVLGQERLHMGRDQRVTRRPEGPPPV